MNENILSDYQGIPLYIEEVEVLHTLENQLKKKIPPVNKITAKTVGVTVEENHVTGLAIYNQELSCLPEIIDDLRYLQWLNIRFNKLHTLPETIGNLVNLQKLDLAWNQISSLPASFGNLRNLGWLNLHENQLTFLPETFGNLRKLGHLSLSNNRLQTLPENIGSLTNLMELWLNKNQLQVLPSNLGKLPGLYKLNLRENKLSSLPESLGDLQSLRELDLEKNQLETLPVSFGNLKVSKLLLSYNRLTSVPKSFASLIKRGSGTFSFEGNPLTGILALFWLVKDDFNFFDTDSPPLFTHPLLEGLDLYSLKIIDDAFCPFCGAAGLVIAHEQEDNIAQEQKDGKERVFCHRCENIIR
ncbi:MAG: leucine-rich repeat domain-containing protein [Promethearchaeota archaeon]